MVLAPLNATPIPGYDDPKDLPALTLVLHIPGVLISTALI